MLNKAFRNFLTINLKRPEDITRLSEFILNNFLTRYNVFSYELLSSFISLLLELNLFDINTQNEDKDTVLFISNPESIKLNK